MSEQMQVRRVETERGSHIEPPLDPTWNAEAKLVWHAAVTAADTGLPTVTVSRATYKTKVFGVWRATPGQWFNVGVGSSTAGPMDFDRAWGYLNGVAAGARAMADAQ